MKYEFKVGQRFRNKHSVNDISFQIINIFEHEGVKLVTCKHCSPEVKKCDYYIYPEADLLDAFNFGMEEVTEFEYICVTCGKITKREDEEHIVIKCDNCGRQAMLK